MRLEKIPGYCPQCVSRCGCLYVLEDGEFVRVEPNPEHPTGQAICVKGEAAPGIVSSPSRLLYPLRRTTPKGSDPKWERISWEAALDYTAEQMRRTAKAYGSESVIFSLTTRSGTAILDSFSWILRLANAFGTPNSLIGTENCNWHKDFTTMLTFGAGTGMPDFENTHCVILWGFNPSVTWLAFATQLKEARKRGARVVVVDPREAGFAHSSDIWVRVRPGTDGALALGMAGVLLNEGWYDTEFVTRWTNGPFLVREDNGRFLTEAHVGADSAQGYTVWDEKTGAPCRCDPRQRAYPAGVTPALFGRYRIETMDGHVDCTTAFSLYAKLCTAYTPERVQSITGVPAEQVRAAARLLHENRPASWFGWTGICGHTNATQTTRAINLLYTLTGCLDAPGGNVYFTKPKINDITGYDLLPPGQREKTLGLAERPLGPARLGWITGPDLYKAVLEKEPYPVKGMLGFGQNILLTQPCAERGRRALAELDFYVHADMFLSPTSYYADVVLPVASPWEREGFCPGFQVNQAAESHIQLRKPVVPPRGEARSDLSIVFELAKRLGLSEQFFGGSPDAGLRHLLEPSGISLERLRSRPEGITLPLTTSYRKYLKNGFSTPSGKIEIYSEQLLEAGQPPLPEFAEPGVSAFSRLEWKGEFPFILTSAKVLAFCHSQHREIPELLRLNPEPLVEIHPHTASGKGIAAGEWVRIRTPQGAILAKAKLNNSLSPQTVCAQYGWWNPGDGEEPKEAAFNYGELIDSLSYDPVSGSASFRSYLCDIERAELPARTGRRGRTM